MVDINPVSYTHLDVYKRQEQIHGVDIWYAKGKRRLEQCRYSFETLKKETGFGTDDLNHRVMDFGLEEAFLSHHPSVSYTHL